MEAISAALCAGLHFTFLCGKEFAATSYVDSETYELVTALLFR
jgi:hypothetical protein